MTTGWLTNILANGNVVDAGGATVSKSLFKAGLKALPAQYQQNPALLQNFISFNNKVEYQDTLANRVGGLGDTMTQNGPGTDPNPLYAYNMMVKGVGLMPAANGIMTNPKNLIFGIHRQVSLEFTKNIQTRTYIIVLTGRVDFAVEEPLATIGYENIGAA